MASGKYEILKDGVRVLETSSAAIAEREYQKYVKLVGKGVSDVEMKLPPYVEREQE